MKILLTAIGKRVQLINHLKASFEIVGIDLSDDAPAIAFVDVFYKVGKVTDSDYVQQVLDIALKEQVECIIPLYEKEFEKLVESRMLFEAKGIKVLLSSKAIIDFCNDKIKTNEFFKRHKINCPSVVNEIHDIQFPLIVKPRDGMGSQNVFKVHNQEELNFFKNYVKNPIVESYVEGEEYTIDVLCDFEGNPIYIVPRKRLEVRSGEVSKSQVRLDDDIIEQVEYVINCLNEYKDEQEIGVQGPITIQCFKADNGSIMFLEINPRFGGGVPLSFEAGADYGQALSGLLNNQIVGRKYDFLEIKMLRYDHAIFK